MSIYVETYNHTRMMGASFTDLDELKEYIEDRMEKDHEVVIDYITVNDTRVNLDDMTTSNQLKTIEELESISGKDLDFIMQVKSTWNESLDGAMTMVYEGYKAEGDTKLDAFREFYEEINYELIQEVPEQLRDYIDWEDLMHDKLTDTWDCYNVGKEYLFIFK